MPRRDEHIRYYPNFRWVIPNFEAGYQCVTLPFAMGLNPFDLHALDTPPAFILSQDQTLIKFFTWLHQGKCLVKTGGSRN